MHSTTRWLPIAAVGVFAAAQLAASTHAADSSRDSGSQRQDSTSQHDQAQHHAGLGVSLAQADGAVRVIAVAPGSPAAKAGVRVGDEIRYVNDQRIRTHGLVDEIGEFRPGERVSLTVERNGEKHILHATLADRNALFNERQANRGRTAYSYGPDEMGSQQGSPAQQVQHLQRQVYRLQQQVNAMQAARGGRGTTAGWGTQPSTWESRTDVNRSAPRGWARDHGPRETIYGTVAPED